MFTPFRSRLVITHRERQKGETRAQLLAAARRLFAQRGFDRTTLRDVAAEAGVAVGTVFVHFPDKRVLLQDALHDELEGVVREARATAPADGTARLLHMARHLYAYYARDPALSAVLVKEAVCGPLPAGSPSERVLAEFLADAAAALESSGQRRPDVHPLDAARTFFALYLAVLLGGLQQATLHVDDMVDQLERLLRVAFPPAHRQTPARKAAASRRQRR